MGNSCRTLRGGGYNVIQGSADAQETSFDDNADVRRASAPLATAPRPADDEEEEIPATQRAAAYQEVHNQVRKLERTDSVDNMITCCICLDTMYEPVRAPCDHVFCKVCIRRLIEYEANRASCPKCRGSLSKLNPDNLEVDLNLLHTIQFNFGDELEERQQEVEEEEKTYQAAREERLRRERLMESDPLSLMFESDEDPQRRRVLQRDLALLKSLGFSTVLCQKALFVSSGVHAEALHWLLRHQHHPNADVPWNMNQLQEQMAMRNTRRGLIATVLSPTEIELFPGRLNVSVSSMSLAATMGAVCWCLATTGFKAYQQPEVVILLQCHQDDDVLPPDLLKAVKRMYMAVTQGTSLYHGQVIDFGLQDGQTFLSNSHIRGLMLTKDYGQQLQGVPLPKVRHLFGVFLKGTDLEFAERYPTSYLIKLGRKYRSDFPFPIINDRFREQVTQAADLTRFEPLAIGTHVHESCVVRVTPESGSSYVVLQLPFACKQQLRDIAQDWPDDVPLPLLTDLARGADSHLVSAARRGRPQVLSIGNSQMRVLSGSACVFVPSKTNASGARLVGDTYAIALQANTWRAVLDALANGVDYSLEQTSSGSMRFCIQWLSAERIDSGLHHVAAGDFSSGRIFEASDQVARVSTNTLLPILASDCDEVQLPDLTPRLRVLAIALGVSQRKLSDRLGRPAFHALLNDLLIRINREVVRLLLPPDQCATRAPSVVTVHVEIKPPRASTFRISKTWTDHCPQMPTLTMRRWSEILHPTKIPTVTGRVEFQLTFEIH
eukprot:TRINITY_DN10024_c0_g1_i4.p1 TRINITY_DN10024_c0_g1~~TRINITY_DN10024_c0_g1_i4.p1  ORF type:complete len:778 (+),score=157.72 TRINITY_DN10024_c0_g1_i4:263-2596(+)